MKYIVLVADGMADYPIQELGNKNPPQAANNLLLQVFSQFKSPEQLYALPSINQVKLVSEAIEMWYSQPRNTEPSTPLALILVAVIGVTIVITSIFAYRKLGTH